MNAADWAERHWVIPETRQTIRLARWERNALEAMFPPDGSRSPWETFLISAPKKAGKTELNAIATTFAAMTFTAPETAFVVANDALQATERVFDRCARALRAMGLERRGAVSIARTEITFRETGSRIVAIPADFAGAAGAVFGVSSWTELWAFRHEGHVRLWEELTPIPERQSLRIVDSYAGFTGDSPILEPMWAQAVAGERLDDELPVYGNGKLWAFIATGMDGQGLVWRGSREQAEEYYAEQAATLRPGTFARLHLNQWASGDEAFLTAEDWDRCTIGDLSPVLPSKEVVLSVGVDAATKGDCAAAVAVARDSERLRLVRHRIWTPGKDDPLDLEETVERFVLKLHEGYRVAAVRYDPYQMARSAATLAKAGVRMVEYPQTSGNLTAAGQNLYELVRGRNLAVYPDVELRRHALNAVAVDTGRGWRLAKEKSSRKIDGIVALSFACLDAIDRKPAGGGVLAPLVVDALGRALERDEDADACAARIARAREERHARVRARREAARERWETDPAYRAKLDPWCA